MKKIAALVIVFCFVFLLSAEAFAAKPSIKKQPETATTSKAGSVTFSVTATGDVTSYSWFFVNPKTGKKISGKKLPKKVKGVKVTGANRPKITLSKVPESMHGWLVYCVVGGGNGHKVDSEYATLLVYGMDAPEAVGSTELVITKQPVDTAISKKGTLVFTVGYSGLAEKITWAFINPKDGQKVIGKNILKKFKDLKVSGINKAKLSLSNVPEAMVGWKVYAHIVSKGKETNTDTVLILAVGEKPAATPAPVEQAAEPEEEVKPDKIITVTCSDSVLRKLDGKDQPVDQEPASTLEFVNIGSFIVSSDKPIKSWTVNGIVNEPAAPVHEFKITNITDDLNLTLTYAVSGSAQ